MLKNYKNLLLAAVGATLAAPASAFQDAGWFFGVTLNRPQARLEVPGIRFAAPLEENGIKLAAGYQFGPHWRAEMNYLDFSRSIDIASATNLARPDDRGKGLRLFGTATMPLTQRLGVFGKLGALHSNLESGCMTTVLTCTPFERGTDLSYGVGLSYDLTKTVSVTGEWERFRRFGGVLSGDPERDVFSIGLGFRF